MSNRSPSDATEDPEDAVAEGAWEIRAGYAYAAVGICSLAAYPIGAILLEAKCEWSCVPTVSDVERPLQKGADVFAVDVIRSVLLSVAALMRLALVPTILIQVFQRLRLHSIQNVPLQFLRVAFYSCVTAWTVSDVVQVAVGNTQQHGTNFTLHTIAVHVNIIAMIAGHIVFLVSLAFDAESGRPWLVSGTAALLKLSGLALFLTVKLSMVSVVWHFAEWAMMAAIGGLHISVGMAMPPSLKLKARGLKVSRTGSSCALRVFSSDVMGRSWGSLPQSQMQKRWP